MIVEQTDPKGCGLAVVAMVTGKSYAAVRKRALLAKLWRPSYGMNGRMLSDLLDRLGWTVLRETFRYVEPVSKTAVVKINADVPHESGKKNLFRRMQHWVVWHNGKLYDPATGYVWEGGTSDIDGLELYLASIPGVDARTGRWFWV